MRMLEGIGFVWSAQHELWEERLAELVDYRARHGHCNVPNRSKSHPKLCVWVKSQRRHYKLLQDGSKHSCMTMERIRRLDDIGFVWKPREMADSLS